MARRRRPARSVNANFVGPLQRGQQRRAPGAPRRRRRAKGGQSSPGSMAAMRSICALTDPFCQASVGTRWPDDSCAVTIPYHYETLFTITSGAAGTYSAIVAPNFPYPVLTSTIAGTTATGAATYQGLSNEALALASTNVSQIRCISFGIQLLSTASVTDSAGYFVLQEFPTLPAVSTTWTTPSNTGPATMMGSLKTADVTWISSPRGPFAHSFSEPCTSNTIQPNAADWTAVAIHLASCPAGKEVAVVRIVANFEFTTDAQDTMYALGKATPPKPALTAAASQLKATSSSLFSGGIAMFGKYIEDRAVGILKQAGASALGYLTGGPAGAALGAMPMIMDVD